MRGPRRSLLLAAAVVAVAVALTWRFGPALTLSLALVSPAAERWMRPVLGDPERQEIIIDGGKRLHADLYRPPRVRGALLLVHGLSEAGRHQPDLERLARLLAAHGQLVLVPHFEGLARFRLTGQEVDDIRRAIRHLQTLHRAPGIAGFSFGAGPALVAAAETPGLTLAASFGGYADLRHVIAFITTGVHSFRGQRRVEAQEEYNRWKLLAMLAGFVEDDRERERLEAVVARRLANPSDDTRALETTLGAEGRALLALVENRDEAALATLLDDLSARAREAMDRLSPLAVVARLPGRVLVAHGAADRSIPYTESLRLAEASGGRAEAVILRTFHHAGSRPAWLSRAALADLWRLVRLADALLGGG